VSPERSTSFSDVQYLVYRKLPPIPLRTPLLFRPFLSESAREEGLQSGYAAGIPGTMSTAQPSITCERAPSLIALFLGERAGAIAASTVATYARKLTVFHHWWQGHESSTPLSETLGKRYAHWLATDILRPASAEPTRLSTRETGGSRLAVGGTRSKPSQGLHLSAVRQWCLWLVSAGHLSENPFAAVAGPPRARWLRHRLLTRTDLQGLLKEFDQDTTIGLRNYLLAALMIRTGARESELAAANIGDLTEYGEEGSLLFLHSKGKAKQEPVIVRPDLSPKLWGYLHHRYPDGRFPPSDPLFTNHDVNHRGERMTTRGMRKQLKEAFTQAGLARPHVTALSLRLSGGALAYRKGASPSEVKQTMRHESIRTTQVLIDQVNRIRFGAERYLDDIQ
jgi:site-specific recombinase XerD